MSSNFTPDFNAYDTLTINSYGTPVIFPSGWARTPIPGSDSNNYFSANDGSGFNAATYFQTDPNDSSKITNVVIAFRGTEPTSDPGDLLTDINIATGHEPQQFADAQAYYQVDTRAFNDTNYIIDGNFVSNMNVIEFHWS